MTPPKQPLQRLFLFLLAALHMTQAFGVAASVSLSSLRCSGRPSRVAAELPAACAVVATLLDNSGTIQSDGALTLTAADLVNRSGLVRAGGDARIDIANDLTNLSGTIRGRTLDIAAGRDILNATAVARLVTATIDTANGGTTTIGRRTQTEDLAGVQGAFVADAGLSVNAGRDLALAGGSATAGGDAAFAAGRDLALATQTQESISEQSFAFGSASRAERAEIASAVEAGGRFSATAGNDLTVSGSTVTAGTSLAASAGNALSVVAVAESSAGSTSLDQGRSGGSAQYRTDTLRGSTLAAGQDLSLSAGTAQAADLTVAASRVAAGNDAVLAASGSVVVASMAETASLSASNWGARDNASVRKERASAVGSVVQAGNDLTVTSTGNLVVEGSALEAGRNLTARVGSDLQLLAATSTRRESVQSSHLTRRKAESLAFELDQNRQLLSTITAGSGIDLQVGGNVSANVGTKDDQGNLQADRMTANGVVKGTDRQQVSVGGSGSTAGVSQVLGNLSGQGIRNGANDAFAATATKEGQAAVNALLQSGLVGIRNHPDLQAILATPTPNGAAVTYKDDSGKVQLTFAGQAKVQEVYSALRLTETFDVQKFADPGMGQIVTLVAAIALTATSGGAGAALLGAEGAVSAAMANAAFTSMTSTMIGQMAGGASLGDALAAGLQAAASSALTAGILNTPIIDGPNGMQSLNQWAGIQDVAGTGAKLARGDWSNLGQTAAGIGLRGAVNASVSTAIYGGSFGQAFTSSVVGDAAAIGANVVGQATNAWSPANIAGHALVGGVAARIRGQDALSGAIGGAVGSIVAPSMIDSLAGDNGNLTPGQQAAVTSVSMLASAAVAQGLGGNGLVAATAAQNEALNNALTKIQVRMIGYSEKQKTNVGVAKVFVEGEALPRQMLITSGTGTADPTAKNLGPTPAGQYAIDPAKAQNMSLVDRILGVNQGNNEPNLSNFLFRIYPSDWGAFRAPLDPAPSTNTANRTDLYLHGGTYSGSGGCIDCGSAYDKWLFQQIRDTKQPIPVEVLYGPR